MSDAILVVNAGSSSVKFALYGLAGETLQLRWRGLAEGLNAEPRLIIRGADGGTALQQALPADAGQAEALAAGLDWLQQHGGDHRLVAAGHRVVHGGPRFAEPVRLDAEVLNLLAAYTPLAPLHQPHNLAAVEALARLRPQLPQVACFDTAFHRSQPDVAQRFGLPRRYAEAGVLRYGFHGLSYQHIARVLPDYDPALARGRVLVAHLGNGASMAALQAGRSVATSMGFTALDGLPMGERCGAIDPGVILYMLQHEGLAPDAIERLLYRESGLKGMSGLSGDMRALLAAEADHPAAREALEYYVYRAVREAGSMIAAMGGLDGLVFTAGVGENAAPIRERIASGLAWAGLRFDPAANRRGAPRLSSDDSAVGCWVIPTDEEIEIARAVVGVVG